MKDKEEKEGERRVILNEISHNNKLDEHDDRRLQQLQQRYNHVMEQTNEAHASVLSDPCKALPFDLWETIVLDALNIESSYDSSGNSDTWAIDRLLLLTSVSKYWEKAIISTQSFWTKITLLPETEDLAVKVALSLHLSRDSLLSISIKLPITTVVWNQLGCVLTAESSRVRSLTLFGSQSTTDGGRYRPMIGIDTILDSFPDLSSLESFAYRVEGDGGSELGSVLLQAPKLRSLKGVKLLNDQAEPPSLDWSQDLETPDPFVEVIPVLYRYRSLRRVIFSATLTGPSQIVRLKERFNVINQPALLWNVLRIEQGIVEGIDQIMRGISSTLVELKLSMSWDMLPEFIICFSDAKRLESLSLTFPCPFAYGFETLPSSLPMLYLHTLRLVLGDHSLYQKINPQNLSSIKGADDCLFDALTTWAPFVKNLNIFTCTGRPSCHLYAESLRNLENYSIQSWTSATGEGEQDRTIKLQAVKDLRFTGYDVFFVKLDCPSLVRVKSDITNRSIEGFILNDALRMNPAPWQTVQHIELSDFRLTWWEVPLPNLETITVSYSRQLIQALANQPTAFPSLHHLRLRQVPNWDILFILLERRNFRIDREVSMIKTLSLPSLPSPAILHPLVDRLRGLYSPRPSNFEISMDSIGPLGINIDMLGCWACHRCLAFCGGSAADLPADSPFIENVMLPELPPYPDTDDEIVEMVITRSNAWESAVITSGRTRIQTCDMRNGMQLTDVTGFTDTGLFEVLVE